MARRVSKKLLFVRATEMDKCSKRTSGHSLYRKEAWMTRIGKRKQHRHLRLAMEKRGWNSTKTAEFLGVSRWVFSSMLNLKYRRPEISRNLEQKLMQLTEKTVDELWPGANRWERRKKAREAKFMRRLTPELLAARGLFQVPPGQEEVLRRRDMRVEVNRRLRALSPPEARVMREIYLEGGTLTDAAGPEWVTRQNAHAIRRKAIEKLSARARH